MNEDDVLNYVKGETIVSPVSENTSSIFLNSSTLEGICNRLKNIISSLDDKWSEVDPKLLNELSSQWKDKNGKAFIEGISKYDKKVKAVRRALEYLLSSYQKVLEEIREKNSIISKIIPEAPMTDPGIIHLEDASKIIDDDSLDLVHNGEDELPVVKPKIK